MKKKVVASVFAAAVAITAVALVSTNTIGSSADESLGQVETGGQVWISPAKDKLVLTYLGGNGDTAKVRIMETADTVKVVLYVKRPGGFSTAIGVPYQIPIKLPTALGERKLLRSDDKPMPLTEQQPSNDVQELAPTHLN